MNKMQPKPAYVDAYAADPDFDQRSIERERETDMKFAVAAMQNLFEFSEKEAQSYFDFASERPYYQLCRAIKSVFQTPISDYQKRIETLAVAILRYEKWVDRAFDSPLVQKVMAEQLDYDKIGRALLETQVEKRAGEEILLLPGNHVLDSDVILLRHEIDRFSPPAQLKHLRALINSINYIFKSAAAVTNRYVADLADKIISLSPSYLRDRHEVSGAFISSSENAINSAIENLEKFRDSYVKLKEPDDMCFLDLFSSCGIARPELVKFTAEKLDKAKQKNVDRIKLRQLVYATETNERVDIFDYVCGHQECVGLYKKLKKTGIKDKFFIDFLLANGNNDKMPTNSIYETVRELANKPSQLRAAACIMEHVSEFLIDPNVSALEKIALSNTEAGIILEDYFTAASSNDNNKAKLMLLLGTCKPDPITLKWIRRSLSTMSDEELKWANEDPNITTIKKRLGANIGGVPRTEKKATATGKSWFDIMVNLLKERKPESVAIVQEAYRKIPDYSYRFRNVLRTQPGSLDLFCQDVIEFSGTAAYRLVLGNLSLFETYKAKLKNMDDDFRAGLREVAHSENSNVYSAVYSLFHPEVEQTSEPEDATTSEKLVKSITNAVRLIIWGGQYSVDKKRKITESAPNLKVEIYDFFNRRKDISGVREGDVVICVTTSMSHMLYDSLKSHCMTRNIDFYHFNHQGYIPLIGFIHNLVG